MAFQILEPSVSLTDYVLTIESIILVILLVKLKVKNLNFKQSVIGFYIFLGLSSFFGGTVHGFFPNDTFLRMILWKATLLSLGVVAFFTWKIVLEISNFKFEKQIFNLALVNLVIYSLYILFIGQQFSVALYNSLVPVVLLLIIFYQLYVKNKESFIFMGLVGIGLTFAAAIVRQLEISIHSVYFNYNAFFHLIQAVALVLIFFAFKYLLLKKFAR